MNLSQKNSYPKAQMIINQLLKQSQQNQLNFKHQQYSILVKHSDILSINFYDVYLQDIDWCIQFRGVQNVNHVSISYNQRRRIRLIYVVKDTIYFYQGSISKRQSRDQLRLNLLSSKQILNIPFSKQDSVLFISDDAYPTYTSGMFVICTKMNKFYAVKAKKDRTELYDLNQDNIFTKIYSTLTTLSTLASSFNTTFQVKTDKHIVVNSIVIQQQQRDIQIFKLIITRDFQLQIMLVNTPIIQNQTTSIQIIHKLDIKVIMSQQIKDLKSSKLISIELYQLNQQQIVGIWFVKNNHSQKDFNFYLISTVIKINQGEIRSLSQLPLNNHAEFQRLPGTDCLIVKTIQKGQTIIMKLNIITFQQQDSITYPHSHKSLLSASLFTKSISLLTPFKSMDLLIQPPEKSQIQSLPSQSSSQSQEIINQPVQIESFLGDIKQMKFHLKNNDYINLGDMLGLRQSQARQYLINNSQGCKILSQEKFKIQNEFYVVTVFVKVMVQNGFSQFNQVLIKDKIAKQLIQQLLHTPNSENLSAIFNLLIQNKHFIFILNSWTESIQIVKKQLINKSIQFKQIHTQILNKLFIPIQKHILNINLLKDTNYSISFIQFLNAVSGIIVIDRDFYRSILDECDYVEELTNSAIDNNNFQLFCVMFFETKQLQGKDLKEYFQNIKKEKNSDQASIKQFIRNFIKQFTERVKQNKVQKKAQLFKEIIKIFHQYLDWTYLCLKQFNSKFYLLLGLQLGHRSQLIEQISQVAAKISNSQNKEKLFLTLQTQKNKQENIRENIKSMNIGANSL